MPKQQHEQFFSFLNDATDILLLLPEDAPADTIASAYALGTYIESLEKNLTTVLRNTTGVVDQLSFLEKPAHVDSSLAGRRDFVLTFDTSETKIAEVRTEEINNEFKIFVSPKDGSIDPRNFSFVPARFHFDLIITLGAMDKESFGSIYEDTPDMFYEITTVNIDYHTENENFGQLNIVDVRASSVSEILTELFDTGAKDALHEARAKSLLTGIIQATDCFKKKNTTPRALHFASTLMEAGADQQEIIRHLYKTQPFSILKLWGRAMARLRWEKKNKMAWATLTNDDFQTSNTAPANIPTILEKIKTNYAAGQIFAILFETPDGTINGIVDESRLRSESIFEPTWDGVRHGSFYEFTLAAKTLPDAAKELLEKTGTSE